MNRAARERTRSTLSFVGGSTGGQPDCVDSRRRVRSRAIRAHGPPGLNQPGQRLLPGRVSQHPGALPLVHSIPTLAAFARSRSSLQTQTGRQHASPSLACGSQLEPYRQFVGSSVTHCESSSQNPLSETREGARFEKRDVRELDRDPREVRLESCASCRDLLEYAIEAAVHQCVERPAPCSPSVDVPLVSSSCGAGQGP